MVFMRVEDFMNWCDITLLDFQTLINFTIYKNNHFIDSDIDLNNTARVQIQ